MSGEDSASGSSDRNVKQHKRVESVEANSLKRGRAESVEPPVLDRPDTSTGSKKNRLALSTGQPPSKPMDPDPSPNIDLDEEERDTDAVDVDDSKEAKNVGEVRRKVEKMTYEEGGAGKAREQEGQDAQEVLLPGKGEDDGPNSAMSTSTRFSGPNDPVELDDDWQEIDKEEAAGHDTDVDDVAFPASSVPMEAASSSGGQEGLKRKVGDRSESSFTIDKGEGQVKRQKDTPSPSEEPPKVLPAVDAPPKKQSAFSSFASTSSPFATTRTASPLDASSSGSVSTPKPNAFKSSGFGNYSSTASPFAKRGAASPFGATTAKKEDKPKSADEDATEAGAGPSSFGDILKADAGPTTEAEKIRMAEQDVHTGEEEESTTFSVRTKLYVMQADGGWRERGVGTLKLNVRRSDGKGARLVMRAEGVLRLILNVSLYVGMSCLEDGKHVRTTVIEDGERKFLTFRTGSNKAATELSNAIHDHIPLESTASQSSRSPDPEETADAAEQV